ncbi:hypothetical protein OFL98_26510, partial [Escherichia coli]|nr:hypothetical protein [Escherichia coli]
NTPAQPLNFDQPFYLPSFFLFFFFFGRCGQIFRNEDDWFPRGKPIPGGGRGLNSLECGDVVSAQPTK